MWVGEVGVVAAAVFTDWVRRDMDQCGNGPVLDVVFLTAQCGLKIK